MTITFENEKPNFGKLPYSALVEAVAAFDDGDRKYEPGDWRNRLAREECLQAAQRHLMKLVNGGEELDGDSGLPHTAHVLARVMMAVELGRAVKPMDTNAGAER